MGRKQYKQNKRRNTETFLMLYNWMTDSPAWLDLSPTARSLYLEMKKRFNGANNGEVRLSHREAAQRLKLSRNTVGRYFKELEAHCFIRAAQGHCLGPSGIGQTTHWVLEELDFNGQAATKAFMRWKSDFASPTKQKPRTKPKPPRPKVRDTSLPDTAPHCPAVIEFGTYLSKSRGLAS
jgi:DNA-binding transcriptional MocR family regulator